MDALEKLLELDDRHNELLEQLAKLDAKILETLSDWGTETTQQSIPISDRIAFPKSHVKAA